MIYDGESIEQAKQRVAAELSVGYTSIDIDKKAGATTRRANTTSMKTYRKTSKN